MAMRISTGASTVPRTSDAPEAALLALRHFVDAVIERRTGLADFLRVLIGILRLQLREAVDRRLRFGVAELPGALEVGRRREVRLRGGLEALDFRAIDIADVRGAAGDVAARARAFH